MNILYALQEMRHPIITELMVLITNLGSELLAIVVGATVFWCMDKIHGYYIFANIFFGAGVNHILKSCVRTPRPFDLEPDFEIVERAREGASGYSFPSGHTQNAFAVFGSLAVIFRRSIGSILCIAVIVLIAFSRLYLGVHYPSDVLGAALIGIILLPLLYLILEKSRNNPKLITILFGIGAVIFLAAGLIFEYGPWSLDIDPDNLALTVKVLDVCAGGMLGIAVGAPVERRYISFETKAVWWVQVLKVALGSALTAVVYYGMRVLGKLLFFDAGIRYTIRLFIVR